MLCYRTFLACIVYVLLLRATGGKARDSSAAQARGKLAKYQRGTRPPQSKVCAAEKGTSWERIEEKGCDAVNQVAVLA